MIIEKINKVTLNKEERETLKKAQDIIHEVTDQFEWAK